MAPRAGAAVFVDRVRRLPRSIAVGAMHDAQFRPLIDDAYSRVANGELLARSRYYHLSWTALTLLLLTGNLIEFPP